MSRRRGRKNRPDPESASPASAGDRSLLHAWPDETLDLHGRSTVEAERATRNFVETQIRLGSGRILHVITGKGTGTLYRAVGRLLRSELQSRVAESAPDLQSAGYRIRLR